MRAKVKTPKCDFRARKCCGWGNVAIWGEENISASGVSPKWVKSRRRRRKRRKKKKKKVGENNGQLPFVRHHGWRTQARLDQNSSDRL